MMSVFLFGDDLFDRNNSRKARIWFAFPPKSDGSSLTGGEAWNIAVLSGTLRMANANCLSCVGSIHVSKRSSFDERFSFYAAAKMKIHFTILH